MERVRPQPEVTQVMPAAKTSADSARQTGDTLVPRRAGVDSLIREMSLLMVRGFQAGWVNTCGQKRWVEERELTL